MRFIILALFAFWWWALIRAFLMRGGNAFGEWPISNQITGKLSEPFDFAFVGIAAATIMAPFALGVYAPWVIAIAALGGVGCLGVMLTRAKTFLGIDLYDNERAHITFAGIAFGGAGATFAACGWQRHDYVLLAISCLSMVPALIETCLHLKPIHEWIKKFSRTEWATAIGITVAVVYGCLFR